MGDVAHLCGLPTQTQRRTRSKAFKLRAKKACHPGVPFQMLVEEGRHKMLGHIVHP